MFHALRQWWSGGRGKVTARLFAFELSVVILGVFIAQAIASWAQDRSAKAQMEAARARTEADLAVSANVALIWKAAAPCLRLRFEQIQRRAAIGPIEPGEAARPTMRLPPISMMSDQSALLFRQTYGDDRADLVADVIDDSETLTQNVGSLQRVWYRLALADPRSGQVGPADLQAAREASADALASLRTIEIAATGIILSSRILKLRATHSNPGIGPAASCDAIWKSGRIDPPLAMR